MSYSRRTLGTITAVIVMAAMVGGLWYRLQGEASESEESDVVSAEGAGEDAPNTSATDQFSTVAATPVVGEAVVQDTLWITVAADGRAAAIREATVRALVEGQVREVSVRENSRVGAGQVAVTVDSTEYALALRRERSNLLNSEAEYQRLVVLDDLTEIAPDVREQRDRMARARSGLDQTEVALEQAELDYARTRVAAPFAGRIADLRVVTGSYVQPGDELFTVVALDPIKVEANVLEKDLALLAEGRSGRVTFTALPGETFEGRIQAINPRVDAETGAARVTLHVRNPRGLIRPGMYANVELDAESFPNRILVPRAAILEKSDDRRTMLFVFNPEGDDVGRAEWRYVTVGRENDTQAEILEDPETFMVDPGEVVLVEGHHYIVHDAVVRLVDNLAPGEARSR